MTAEERKALIEKLIIADYQNVTKDFRLFHWIMHDGWKGYMNMTDQELLKLENG